MSVVLDTSMTVKLGKLGIWRHHSQVDGDFAAKAEELGYSAIWLGGSPGGDLAVVDELLAATRSLVVATGIVNIWTDGPGGIAAAHHRITDRFDNRFLLGVGAGHREATAEYRKPFEALVDYLDGLAEHGVPAEETVLAALGPKVLALAAGRTAGAHPYLTTPAHTKEARSLVGDALLVPDQKVVLDTDSERARALARKGNDFYLGLTNYRANLKRLGFTDADLDDGGTDRLWDALVPHGDGDVVAAAVQAHLTAGADQVAVQVVGRDPWPALTAIAQRLA
ncbi:LLM class F420-dependent oxidoreductase [Gordonia crocea]|uniref:LLM class F420-dependent oxidoreductase n=2 Tax=Gordonia crocea TaxID=589162 RepID=A0A7I9UZT6_9ACTN|nr:LLM class F420-dependent oxidoreductase [Gordonia crocea]GED98381.1 LLM class F420-dependent oxidoreductase [Gordonia crocea]